jgi:hypothetical protein
MFQIFGMYDNSKKDGEYMDFLTSNAAEKRCDIIDRITTYYCVPEEYPV